MCMFNLKRKSLVTLEKHTNVLYLPYLVQVKNSYFKNKPFQIVSFNFPLLIFYDNLSKNFRAGGGVGGVIFWNLILRKNKYLLKMSCFPKNTTEKSNTRNWKLILEMSKSNLLKALQKGLSVKNEKHLGTSPLSLTHWVPICSHFPVSQCTWWVW